MPQDHKKYSTLLLYSPLLVCLLVMLPRLLSPDFGLMDDGRSLTVAESLNRGVWDMSWDLQAGRSRPLYWPYFTFWYTLFGLRPFWFFLGNLLIFASTTAALIRLVLNLGGSQRQAWATGMLFALSGPVIENFYTLSKGEGLQLAFLSASLLAAFKLPPDISYPFYRRFAASTFFILCACMAKETTLAIIPISLSWWMLAWLLLRWNSQAAAAERLARWFTLSSFLGGLLFYIGRSIFVSSQLAGVGYTSNFIFTRQQIVDSIVRWGGWMLRDYLYLLPLILLGLTWLLRSLLPRIPGRGYASGLWLFALPWMAAWLGIYLPWMFAVEYYLLPFAAGTAVVGGILFDQSCYLLKQTALSWRLLALTALALFALLLLATQANNAAGAAVQIAQDSANAAVVEYVARSAPENSVVLLNIQHYNEYVEEMEIYFHDVYKRPDLQFQMVQGQDLAAISAQAAVYVLIPQVTNQPLMTVRMGLVEDTQAAWNAALLPQLNAGWSPVFSIERRYPIVGIDFPRLLCPIVYRERYCSAGRGLVNADVFIYRWTVYESNQD